ncbi:MAG: glycosyltransferase [Polyangiaceae bacterium]
MSTHSDPSCTRDASDEHRAGIRLVSLVVPTLNEPHLGASFDVLADQLAKIDDGRFEILVVDDSQDEERKEVARQIDERAYLAPKIQIRLVNGERRGKGHAVRKGALRSRGDTVIVMDADLPVSLCHVAEFLERLEQGDCDIVVGERPAARNAGQPLRRFLSTALLVMQRSIILRKSEFSDTQCGFKAFRGPVLRSIAARQTIDGGMYDIEYLYMALLDGCRVVRSPVTTTPSARPSKIRLWTCMYTDPFALFRIKATGALGRYRSEIGVGTGIPMDRRGGIG